MGLWAGSGDEPRSSESGGEPETKATWFSRSVAFRLDCGLERSLRMTTDAVMDGSVAAARSSRGLRLLLAVDESLRDMARRDSGEKVVAIVGGVCVCEREVEVGRMQDARVYVSREDNTLKEVEQARPRVELERCGDRQPASRECEKKSEGEEEEGKGAKPDSITS